MRTYPLQLVACKNIDTLKYPSKVIHIVEFPIVLLLSVKPNFDHHAKQQCFAFYLLNSKIGHLQWANILPQDSQPTFITQRK